MLFPFLAKVLQRATVNRTGMLLGYTTPRVGQIMRQHDLDGWAEAGGEDGWIAQLHPAQYGSTPRRRGTLEPLLAFLFWGGDQINSRRGGGLVSVLDQSDAYTTISHARALGNLHDRHGVRGRLWLLHEQLLDGVTLRVLLGARMTRAHEFEVGGA